jgi:exosome complex RNA-binding protein Rrp42 (RNase PH superfamily)
MTSKMDMQTAATSHGSATSTTISSSNNTNRNDGKQQQLPLSTSTFGRSAPSPNLSNLQEWLDLSPTSTTTGSVSIVQSLDPQQYLLDFWQQRTRSDGRLFLQGRPCRVLMGIVKQHAAGSALVNVTAESSMTPAGHNNNNYSDSSGSISTSSRRCSNSTKILAATTLQIGQPSPSQPNHGDVVVQVTGTGGKNMGMDYYFSGGSGGGGGKSKHSWDVLQAWLQRILEEEPISDDDDDDEGSKNNNNRSIPSQLNLVTGKAALRLIMSVQILEDGGNIMDAALLACMAAWRDTNLPKVGKDLVEVKGLLYWKNMSNNNNNNNTDYPLGGLTPVEEHGPTHQPHQRHFRVSLTMGVWKDPQDQTTHLLVDPSLQEEPFLDGRLTIVVDLTTSGKLLQVHYTGNAPLTATDLTVASKLAQSHADELGRILSWKEI